MSLSTNAYNTAKPLWDEPVKDVLQIILGKLEPKNLIKCCLINKFWKTQAENPQFWQEFLRRDFAFRINQIEKIENPKALFVDNFIFKMNLIKKTGLTKNFPLRQDITDLKKKKNFAINIINQNGYPIGFEIINIKDNSTNKINFPSDFQLSLYDLPNLEMLDKDIVTCQSHKILLIWSLSDQKLIKKIPVESDSERINADLLAYSSSNENCLRFFNLNTKKDHPIFLKNVGGVPLRCQQINENIVIVTYKLNVAPSNSHFKPTRVNFHPQLTPTKGLDLLTGNVLFEFDVPTTSYLRFTPLNKNHFIIEKRIATFQHPGGSPWDGWGFKLLGVYDLKGQKIKLDLPASRISVMDQDKLHDDGAEGIFLLQDNTSKCIQLWDIEKKGVTQTFAISDLNFTKFTYNCRINRNRLVCMVTNLHTTALEKMYLWDFTTGELIKEVNVQGYGFKALTKSILLLTKNEEKVNNLQLIDLVDGSVMKTYTYLKSESPDFSQLNEGLITTIHKAIEGSDPLIPYFIKEEDFTRLPLKSPKEPEKKKLW